MLHNNPMVYSTFSQLIKNKYSKKFYLSVAKVINTVYNTLLQLQVKNTVFAGVI